MLDASKGLPCAATGGGSGRTAEATSTRPGSAMSRMTQFVLRAPGLTSAGFGCASGGPAA